MLSYLQTKSILIKRMALLSRFSLLSTMFLYCYLKTSDFGFSVYLIYRGGENPSKTGRSRRAIGGFFHALIYTEKR